jgi:hypothetical protein
VEIDEDVDAAAETAEDAAEDAEEDAEETADETPAKTTGVRQTAIEFAQSFHEAARSAHFEREAKVSAHFDREAAEMDRVIAEYKNTSKTRRAERSARNIAKGDGSSLEPDTETDSSEDEDEKDEPVVIPDKAVAPVMNFDELDEDTEPEERMMDFDELEEVTEPEELVMDFNELEEVTEPETKLAKLLRNLEDSIPGQIDTSRPHMLLKLIRKELASKPEVVAPDAVMIDRERVPGEEARIFFGLDEQPAAAPPPQALGPKYPDWNTISRMNTDTWLTTYTGIVMDVLEKTEELAELKKLRKNLGAALAELPIKINVYRQGRDQRIGVVKIKITQKVSTLLKDSIKLTGSDSKRPANWTLSHNGSEISTFLSCKVAGLIDDSSVTVKFGGTGGF